MRPLNLTEDLISQMVDDFRRQLTEQHFITDQIKYSKDLKEYTKKTENTDKVKVYFTPASYLQMMNLVNHCPEEIGWHGTVTRLNEKAFLIDKILVFPQIVSAATVTPDETAFANWMMQFFEDDEDDTIQRMRFHGHSHVNMGTTASGTDDRYQGDMLPNIKDFYIFLITNKRAEHNIMIYDIENNVYYNKADIALDIMQSDDTSLADWTKKQMEQVQTHKTPETQVVKKPETTEQGEKGKGK